jgi:hypothetical protein
MNRIWKTSLVALPLLTMLAGPAAADVRTRDRTQVKFEGMLGRMMGMFGGKAAKEGVVTTNAVKGNRKAETMGDTSGRIVDLAEEKVYELDLKKKAYTVTTFEELRRRMREAQEKARKQAPADERESGDQQKPAREMEIDFDVQQTGATKTLAGYDTREVVMTVTMREKGRTLEEGGGLVMTSNSWMGPAIPAMKELSDFEMRYWKALAPEAQGMSPEQMAAVLAMYPMLNRAMERLKAEGAKLEGTPLASTTVFETVRSQEQMAQEGESGGGGGLSGMLARRMMKKDAKPRNVVFTITHETLEVTPEVAAAELEIPAGFTEKK